MFVTYFNAGVRVHDDTNHFQPEEVAYFVPPKLDSAASVGINDVYVDENRVMYVVDRIKGGLYILELTI